MFVLKKTIKKINNELDFERICICLLMDCLKEL